MGDRLCPYVFLRRLERAIVPITAPTPTGRGIELDLQYVVSPGESARMGLKHGELVILESTVYPGVTGKMVKSILEKSRLKVAKDFRTSYCSERYNPGDSVHAIVNVAGRDERLPFH